MRRLRYQVACSLDGYIADSNGGFDWIIPEPTFDFNALFAQFDTLLMGRKTYETIIRSGVELPDKRIVVASRSLRQEDHPEAEIIHDGLKERVHELLEQPGKDVWLYGGGELLSQLLDWDLVDTVEPAIIPILLGDGVPMLAKNRGHRRLNFIRQQTYPSGMVLLEYEVQKGRNQRTEM